MNAYAARQYFIKKSGIPLQRNPVRLHFRKTLAGKRVYLYNLSIVKYE